MICLTIKRKGSKTSGWYAPPTGTHSGEKHRAVGSGKAVVKRGVGKGKAALGGVTHEWFDSPAGRKLFGADVEQYDREDIAGVLVAAKVPAGHLGGVIIHTSAPTGYTYGNISYERWVGDRITHANGVHSVPLSGKGLSDIYIHPYVVKSLSGTVVHEVGHQVWHQYRWRAGEDRAKVVMARAADISGKLKGWPSGDLKKMGLRRYSASRPGELIADAYMVKHYGESHRWKALSGFVEGLGLDLDEIFEE